MTEQTQRKVKRSEYKQEPVRQIQGQDEAVFDALVEAEKELLQKVKDLTLNVVTSPRWLEMGKDSIANGFMQMRRAVMRPEEK